MGTATPAAEFTVPTSTVARPVLDVVIEGLYHHEFVDTLQRYESFVPMEWLETVPIANALHKIGLFGNQHTVCQPTGVGVSKVGGKSCTTGVTDGTDGIHPRPRTDVPPCACPIRA